MSMPKKKSKASDEEKLVGKHDEEFDDEDESDEDLLEDMKLGKKDADVYSEAGREELLDDDEISDAEDGFLQGAEAGGSKAKCAECGKILRDKVVEKKIGSKMFRFCSNKCVDKYENF